MQHQLQVGRILFGSSADPLDDQHDQLLQLNGGALLVAAATAAALALAGRGAADGGGLGRGSSGAVLACYLSVCESPVSIRQLSPMPAAKRLGVADASRAPCPFLPADLLRLALAGQGLANALTFLYYGWSFRSFMLPLELVVNGAAFAVPAADLMQGAGLRVRAPRRLGSCVATHVASPHAHTCISPLAFSPLLNTAATL
jgi:hypothetical protein